jgi:hypothetical protein
MNSAIAASNRIESVGRADPADVITIASGLPRSGTSLMMQMLDAGGMSVLTDGLRRSDNSNPRGYFELEAVKQTRQDASWVRTALGRAVKVIYRLLPDLPDGFSYRVIFMRRNLDEVVASQQVMLGRPTLAAVDHRRLVGIFQRELAHIDFWLASRPNMPTHHVQHSEALMHPAAVAQGICEFLQRPLDISAMVAAVQPSLHRQRLVSEGIHPELNR